MAGSKRSSRSKKGRSPKPRNTAPKKRTAPRARVADVIAPRARLERVARQRFDIRSDAQLTKVVDALARAAVSAFGGVPDEDDAIPTPVVPGVTASKESSRLALSASVSSALSGKEGRALERAGIVTDKALANVELARIEATGTPLTPALVTRLRHAANLASWTSVLGEAGVRNAAAVADKLAASGIMVFDPWWLDACFFRPIRPFPFEDVLAVLDRDLLSGLPGKRPIVPIDPLPLGAGRLAIDRLTNDRDAVALIERRAFNTLKPDPFADLEAAARRDGAQSPAMALALARYARGPSQEQLARARLLGAMAEPRWEDRETRAVASALLGLDARGARRSAANAHRRPFVDRERHRRIAREERLGVLAGEALPAPVRPIVALRSSALAVDLASSVKRVLRAATTKENVVVDGLLVAPGAVRATLAPSRQLGFRSDAINVALRKGLLDALDALPALPPTPATTLVAGTLWRFDPLLEEARRVAEHAANTETHLLELAQLIMAQALSEIGTASDALQAIGPFISQLTARIEELAAKIPALLDRLTDQLNSLLVVSTLMNVLSSFSLSWWVELIIVVANDGDIIGYLTGTGVSIDSIRDEVQTQLRTDFENFEQQLRSALDLTALQDTVLSVLVKAGLVPEGTSFEDAGIAVPGLDALSDAIDSIDLDGALDRALDQLTGPEGDAAIRAIIVHTIGTVVMLVALASIPIIGWILLATGEVAAEVQREIRHKIEDARRLVDGTRNDVASVVNEITRALATLDAVVEQLRLVEQVLDGVEALLPEEARVALLGLLDTVRRGQLDAVWRLARVAERAYFRETTEFLDIIPDSYVPVDEVGTAGVLGPRAGLLASNQALADLAQFEASRVAAGNDKDSVQTRVISIAELPGGLSNLTALAQNGYLDFSITTDLLDRVLPGAYRVIVKDIEVLVRFVTSDPIGVTSTLAAGDLRGPITQVAGAGWLVDSQSLPSGLPIVLTQAGETKVRIPQNAVLEERLFGACGERTRDDPRPPKLEGVWILDDDNAGAQARGYRMLVWEDPPETQAFSHFNVENDLVRFVMPPKALKPFENRGLIGSWRLDIPAFRLQTLPNAMPDIENLFIVVSYVSDYDPALAEAVASNLPPLASLPPVGGDGTLPTMGSLGDLGGGLAPLTQPIGDALGVPLVGNVGGSEQWVYGVLFSQVPGGATALAGTAPLTITLGATELGNPAPPVVLQAVVVNLVIASGDALPSGSVVVTWTSGLLSKTFTLTPDANGRAVARIPNLGIARPDGTWTVQLPASFAAHIDDAAFGVVFLEG